MVLPVDDALLEVQPLFRDEVLLISADAERTRAPMSIDELGRAPLILYDTSHGFEDPTRRQLAARAQAAGIVVEARIEVEHVETALQLVGRGLGDTIAARAVLRAARVPPGLSSVAFADPFYDFFALITRHGAQVSPGTLTLLDLVDEWARGVAGRLATE